MKKTAEVAAILSPVIGVISFLTLGNAVMVEDAALNAIGMMVALGSLLVFATSLLVLMIARRGGKVGNAPQPSRTQRPNAPLRWYQRIKLAIGLGIVLGLYLGMPVYAFLRGISVSPGSIGIFFLLSLIGFLLTFSHRRRWPIFDATMVILAFLLMIVGVGMALSVGEQKGSPPIEGIAGLETVNITTADGEGGKTAFVGLCISARIQPPRDDAPDMICGLTDSDGRGAFNVKPGKYYIYLDLRSRDEYNLDPKYPHGYVEWEVLPQSINELEFMVTPKR